MTLEHREFHPADLNDVLALELRSIEKREAWASLGVSPRDALSDSLYNSHRLSVITYKGKICGVFGLSIVCSPQGEVVGIPWLVSNEIPFSTHANRGLFLRTSKKIVQQMRAEVDFLVNIVSLQNKDSIRWLRWLGFTIDDAYPFTFDRDPSLQFVKFGMR